MTKYYGSFKKCVQNSPSPPIQYCKATTLLDASFAFCSSKLLRGGRGEKHKIVQTAFFRIFFVADCRLFNIFSVGNLQQHSVMLLYFQSICCLLTTKRLSLVVFFKIQSFHNKKVIHHLYLFVYICSQT